VFQMSTTSAGDYYDPAYDQGYGQESHDTQDYGFEEGYDQHGGYSEQAEEQYPPPPDPRRRPGYEEEYYNERYAE